MKTTIDLPSDLMREIKLKAVREGRPVKYLVADFLRQGLGHGSSEKFESIDSERISFSEKGVPMIRCRLNAPAIGMTAEQLIAVEMEILHQEEVSCGGGTL